MIAPYFYNLAILENEQESLKERTKEIQASQGRKSHLLPWNLWIQHEDSLHCVFLIHIVSRVHGEVHFQSDCKLQNQFRGYFLYPVQGYAVLRHEEWFNYPCLTWTCLQSDSLQQCRKYWWKTYPWDLCRIWIWHELTQNLHNLS